MYNKAALSIEPLFTNAIADVFKSCEWELRDAVIKNADGSIVFEQKDVEVPSHWSQLATNVVASKYFRGAMDSPSRETSVRQIIIRVAGTIQSWGVQGGYFRTAADADIFFNELVYLLIHQYGAFNSPVWFNFGVPNTRQQGSACFINRVEDELSSIMELASTEALLFKYGSGSGSNMSRLRSSKERLSLGGEASGPLSFIKMLDSVGGAMKSGGTTRRAALMRCMDIVHPDIEQFIQCKADEERKAWTLIDAGYDGGFNKIGGAYDSISFQNANHSVRVTDEFMRAAEKGHDFFTKFVTTGENCEEYSAQLLLDQIAEATHVCGDPGMQYDDTINLWHTCPNTDRIYASNPCCFSGDMYVDTDRGRYSFEELTKMFDAGSLDLPKIRTWDTSGKRFLYSNLNRAWKAKQNTAVLEVMTTDGLNIVCTGDHKFLVVDLRGNERWVEAQYLSSSDLLKSYHADDNFAYTNIESIYESTPCDVYDIEVDQYHKFIVSNIRDEYSANGVVVSNSEFVFLDDTACNLASLNLMKFRNKDSSFHVEAFKHACEIFITSQEIMVSPMDYPSEKIAKNSEDYRPLGLGYANLGSLLMANGLAYDSDDGRALAACITAIMTGTAYAQSARIAANLGPFNGHVENEEPMLKVMELHKKAIYDIPTHDKVYLQKMRDQAHAVWDETYSLGEKHGYRNAQATVLAPTGTIAFMMDCSSTGIEPDIALVKYKRLIGGGSLKLVNQEVAGALQHLGYNEQQIHDIIEYIDVHDTIENCPDLKDEHLSVFDCAFKAQNGTRFIHHMGHIKMMAAVQPFISGAISKTVNVPAEATVEEIADAYMQAWKMGVKAVAIYRDGSKRTQPLSTTEEKFEAASPPQENEAEIVVPLVSSKPYRRKLPDEREAITHKFSVGGQEGYITVGLYEDGTPGELFINMNKEGSTISGLMDSFAVAISMGLQYGVPLQVLVTKFSHTRFEPSGFTTNPNIRQVSSLMDYIFRWMESKFLAGKSGYYELNDGFEKISRGAMYSQEPLPNHEGAPMCQVCGSQTQRAGACYACANCGNTSGCG